MKLNYRILRFDFEVLWTSPDNRGNRRGVMYLNTPSLAWPAYSMLVHMRTEVLVIHVESGRSTTEAVADIPLRSTCSGLMSEHFIGFPGACTSRISDADTVIAFAGSSCCLTSDGIQE